MTQATGAKSGDKEELKPELSEELSKLEAQIGELKVQYEQYFAGLLPLAPERLHAEVKRRLRALMKAPFRSSSLNYRLRALKSRFDTFGSYWRRVLNEREAGTYSRDVFKANLRERFALEDARAQSKVGAAEKSLQQLFTAYKIASEKHTGKTPNLDFKSFEKSIIARAKDFKTKHAGKKLAFKVVVKNGKVTVQARVKQA
jgi:hypothetical protein